MPALPHVQAGRYGPFPKRAAALRFYRTALEGIDSFMDVEIPVEAGLWKRNRKVGKKVGKVAERKQRTVSFTVEG